MFKEFKPVSKEEWLDKVIPKISYRPRIEWLSQISEWENKYPFDTNDPYDGTINTQMVVKEIDNYLSKNDSDYIITTAH